VRLDLIRRALFARETVFEDEGGDAALGEPPSDRIPLVLHHEHAVAASRDHDDGGSGGDLLLRQVQDE
jgi:hypothetical protein